jgi:protein-S-isoprenylcysteine O-methyltransferase Ste14
MRAEERMLELSFGSRYIEYQQTSWRLIPYLY